LVVVCIFSYSALFKPNKSNAQEKRSKVTLGFERGGKISKIYVRPGDIVKTGQVLATLNTTEYDAQVKELQATIEVQKEKVAQLEGNTASNSDRVKTAYGQAAIQNAHKNFVASLRDAYIKADDAIRGKGDQFFSKQYQINISATDSQLNIDIPAKRMNMENILISWKNTPLPRNPDSDFIYEAMAENNLGQISDFLDALAYIVNGQTSDPTLTTVRNGKSDIYTARSNIISALKTMFASEQSLRDAQYKLSQLPQTAGTSADIALQQNQLNELKTRLELLQTQKEQFVLKAYSNGRVSTVSAVEGMTVLPSTPIISLGP